ncbi:MAG: arginine--tRNA ligase [Gammaproteobacteria bacterium]
MKELLKTLLQNVIVKLQEQDILSNEIKPNIHIERTRDKQHGDYASNIALVLAKTAGKKPRDLATLIVENLPKHSLVEEVTVAGPGFINFSLSNDAFLSIIPEILSQTSSYGCNQIEAKEKINIEFVSANPTGPLHVGHGRGAAFGAALSDLLSAYGYDVHREYYVNDAGRQMSILAVSVWLRYLESLGEKFSFPSNGYKGDYIQTIATNLKNKYDKEFYVSASEVFNNLPPDEQADGSGDKEAHIDALIEKTKSTLSQSKFQIIFNFALDAILEDIREDLAEFGVNYQEWFSERSLHDTKAIDKALAILKKNGFTYEHEGAIWFNATQFGDDKDRVLVRENGQTTYFASDVAYLLNKIERGFKQLFYIVGADHHGYVTRLKAAASALGIDPNQVHVLLVQFAVLYRGQERVPMSTRSGSFVTLRELREEIGTDAARFFYVSRKVVQHMDFDLELAKSKSNENPIYYIQYAHARICSVFRQLTEKGWLLPKSITLSGLRSLTEPAEKKLLTDLSRYTELVETAAREYEPNQIAFYLLDIAHDFHTYYNAHQFLVEDQSLRNARISLIMAVKQILNNGLSLLNVSAPEQM